MGTKRYGVRVFFNLLAVLLLAFASAPGALAQDAGLPGPSAAASMRPAPSSSTSATQSVASLPVRGAPGDHYTLGTGDKLKVTVYGEDELSGEVTVDGSGQVQLPLIGQVQAAGLTVHEFVGEVTKSLENGYLKDPRVSVEVENYRPFYIMGEVNKPGEYPYESGLSVLGAVALAGGFTYRADDTEVYIRRNGSADEATVPANSTEKVVPGDIIRVAERIF